MNVLVYSRRWLYFSSFIIIIPGYIKPWISWIVSRVMKKKEKKFSAIHNVGSIGGNTEWRRRKNCVCVLFIACTRHFTCWEEWNNENSVIAVRHENNLFFFYYESEWISKLVLDDREYWIKYDFDWCESIDFPCIIYPTFVYENELS